MSLRSRVGSTARDADTEMHPMLRTAKISTRKTSGQPKALSLRNEA
jgi:hypothetical protein